MVLTAAHCEDEDLDNAAPISFGTTVLDDIDGEHVARPIEYKIHPDFDHNDGGDNFDFMVMKLDKSIPFAPVTLNRFSSVPSPGDALTVMGFGVLNEDSDDLSEVLREVEVNYIDGDTCRNEDLYPEYAEYDFLVPGADEEHLCAGVDGGGKDACYGDR